MGIENGSGIPEFKSENFSRSFALADKFKNSGVLGEKSDPERDVADEKAREILNTSFEVKNAEGQIHNIEYSSVEHMIEVSQDISKTDDAREKAKQALYEVGLALSQDKAIFKAATEDEEELNKLLPPNLHEIQPYILSSYLTEGEGDKDGKELLGEMMDLFKLKRRADKNPEYYRDDFEAKAKSLFTKLSDKCDDASAEDVAKGRVGRWEAMAGFVKGVDDRTGRRPVLTTGGETDEETEISREPDYSAVIENNSNREGYRSPFENTPPAIVDAMFNYEPPRLYLTPPPEWWKKLSSKEQYMWKIQQKLANGIARKLAVKDISAEDARKNEVYNLPTLELKMLYEVPEIRESMETFVQDLFEFYEEDGRKFLRLKLVKNADGSLKKDNNGGYILDPEVAKKVGDIGADSSFELYREEMFKKMALKKLYPSRVGEIDTDWKSFYEGEISAYINKSRENPRNRNKTNAELEGEWITINALEEKRAVATAWNLLCVGNIVESADTCRHLKPTQLNSDKIRTMMMPLEKFIGKSGMRKGELKGDEELFGGKITLWAKRRFEEEGAAFAEKIVYAADHDIRTMTPEQAKWRLFPKRMMCSFNDMYLAETESGEKITLSQALMEKKKIVFKDDDADVFVSLRDTWDEVITVTPFMIGKGEYSPIQQGEKFSSAVEKWRGLVTGINRIKLSDGGGFSHEITPERPEFYAWLLANAIGLELNLDIPILDRAVFKADKDTYNNHVDNMIRLLDLSPKQSSEVRRILSAESWLSARNALTNAERRASFRETAKRRAEKRA